MLVKCMLSFIKMSVLVVTSKMRFRMITTDLMSRIRSTHIHKMLRIFTDRRSTLVSCTYWRKAHCCSKTVSEQAPPYGVYPEFLHSVQVKTYQGYVKGASKDFPTLVYYVFLYLSLYPDNLHPTYFTEREQH